MSSKDQGTDFLAMTTKEISDYLNLHDTLSGEEMYNLEQDRRSSVQRLRERWLERQEKRRREETRVKVMKELEVRLAGGAAKVVAGVDEAGRGPLAGPVMAAAVILPPDFDATGINDSKLLSEARRQELAEKIKAESVSWSVAEVGVSQIYQLNIRQASFLAMREACLKLSIQPDMVLADGFSIPGLPWPQQGIVDGDARVLSIAAASIVAKVERDHRMAKLDKIYPQYGFKKHKGYGTAQHFLALQEFGPCPEHRMGFAPLKAL